MRIWMVIPLLVGLVSTTARAGEDGIYVHIDGAGTLVHAGEMVCAAPCDERVPRAHDYIVVHDGVASRPFSLTSSNHFARVSVRARTKSHAHAGAAVLAATLAAAAVFTTIAVVFATQPSGTCTGLVCPSAGTLADIFGVFAGAVGITGAVVGTGLLLAPTTPLTLVRVDTGWHPSAGASFAVRF